MMMFTSNEISEAQKQARAYEKEFKKKKKKNKNGATSDGDDDDDDEEDEDDGGEDFSLDVKALRAVLSVPEHQELASFLRKVVVRDCMSSLLLLMSWVVIWCQREGEGWLRWRRVKGWLLLIVLLMCGGLMCQKAFSSDL
jgi:hypothetical protein